MKFFEWVAAVFGGMGRVGLILVVLAVVLVLAVPGALVVRALVDLGGDGPVDLREEEERVTVDGVTYEAPDLTREAEYLRKAFEHDATLIASIPTPMLTLEIPLTRVGPGGTPVLAILGDNPGGVPIERDVEGLDWFDPGRGLHFYRETGGDWTPPGVRERSPYRSLVEFGGYPEGVSNFADDSIVYDLAVRLAFGMAEVRPAFGTPTPAMIAVLARDLGWELVEVDEVPAFRVWSTFVFRAADTAEYEFAVGGVMAMKVGELDDGSQYLIAGQFVAPGVVLQRLDVET